ncbi:SPW repeat domain-containing protein [Saccharothrix isguenensis]
MVGRRSDDRATRGRRSAERTRADHTPLGASAASAATLLAGVWLLLAPSVLDYPDGSAARGHDIVIGAAVAVLAVVRIVAPRDVPWLSIVTILHAQRRAHR